MLDWLAERWNDLINFCLSILLSMYDMVTDLFCFAFESLFEIVLLAIDTLGDLFSSLNIIQYFDAIPDEAKSMMALVGINEASSIIVTAILIRLGLQLIPFTRLGS